MDQQSENPYASPASDVSQRRVVSSNGELLPLWIWLAIAVIMSTCATPADPASMFIALAYGLVCLCVGAVLGSSLHLAPRALPLILWIVPAAWLALSFGNHYFAIGAAIYGAVSIWIGACACWRIQYGRLRILTCFCAGYVLGSVLGILGTVGGAVLAALLARRSLRIQAGR